MRLRRELTELAFAVLPTPHRHMNPSTPRYALRDLTPSEKAKWPDGVKFEQYPYSLYGAIGRVWTQAMLSRLNKACEKFLHCL